MLFDINEEKIEYPTHYMYYKGISWEKKKKRYLIIPSRICSKWLKEVFYSSKEIIFLCEYMYMYNLKYLILSCNVEATTV